MPKKRTLIELTKGLVSNFSSDKADGYKTLSDIEQDEIIGGITSRKGNENYTFFNDVSTYQNGVQFWNNKSNKMYLQDTEQGSSLWIKNSDGSLTEQTDYTELKRNAYGMQTQRFTDTYISFLNTLLESAGVRGKNALSMWNGTDFITLGSAEPSRVDIPQGFGTTISKDTNTQADKAGWSRYGYVFVYSDGTKSPLIKSDTVFDGKIENGGQNLSYGIVIHTQRRIDNYTPVNEIEIYLSYIIGGETPVLDDFDEYGYSLIKTLTGDELDERETGDSTQENYVRYEDRQAFIRSTISPYNPINFTEHMVGNRRYQVLNDFPIYEDPEETYIPQPAYIEGYNQRLMALGDPEYPRNLFFSKDYYVDFLADNNVELPFPTGDPMGVGMVELGDSLYCMSENSTVRVTETSTVLPYYRFEPVEGLQGIGCISPKTILKAFGKAYWLSKEGVIEFNGTSYRIISTPINNIIKQIDLNYYDSNGNIVSDPMKQVSYYKPFKGDAVYDSNNTSIYLAIPVFASGGAGYSIVQDIYTTPLTYIYKYNLKTESWSTLTLSNFRSFIKTQGNENFVSWVDIFGNLFSLTGYGKQDLSGNIASVIESIDIDFGEETMFNALNLTGEGTVDIDIYLRKETTARISLTNKTLNKEGIAVPLNLMGRHFRYKITVKNNATFKMTQDPFIEYTQNGIKNRRSING